MDGLSCGMEGRDGRSREPLVRPRARVRNLGGVSGLSAREDAGGRGLGCLSFGSRGGLVFRGLGIRREGVGDDCLSLPRSPLLAGDVPS